MLLRSGFLVIFLFSGSIAFADDECCEEECQQEESCCRRRCFRPRYNPEEEELYRQRTEVLYPSQREGMLETLTHQ